MYVLTTMYDDGFTKAETCNDITEVFSAAAIYLQDRECTGVLCLDIETKELSEDISLSPKKTFRKIDKNKSTNNINKNENKNFQNESLIYGPIITLLKNTVDKYNRKNKMKNNKKV